MVKLSDDLLHLVPFEDGSLCKEVTPDNYVEGPFMLKHQGKYYFMWSEGDWTGPDYCVAYAMADSGLLSESEKYWNKMRRLLLELDTIL